MKIVGSTWAVLEEASQRIPASGGPPVLINPSPMDKLLGSSASGLGLVPLSLAPSTAIIKTLRTLRGETEAAPGPEQAEA